MKKDFKYREIPYNYTSFSDKEIVSKYFDHETWEILDYLRHHRITGRSAKLLFEILGDIFILDRNPYLYDDYLENNKKLNKLMKLHSMRLDTIEKNTDKEIVLKLIKKARNVDGKFFESFQNEKADRHSLNKIFRRILPEESIQFSAFHRVMHVTDATDWRVEYPKVILYPDTHTQILEIVKAARKIHFPIIVRGGGTGLTGGAIPVKKNTIVINTEKMRSISPIELHDIQGRQIPVIEAEAGAITDDVIDRCHEQGYIFATDPTSAWASTIGGNIAENSGGKKAVIWGTAIDNLFSFMLINSDAQVLEVIRRDHPYRKILPDDFVIFDVLEYPQSTNPHIIRTITLRGTDIRKPGVGKDITNKVLGGVPGIQKEGGDGIIISAKFVLYKPFAAIKTLCLEFYGNNLVNASKAIVGIQQRYDQKGPVYLTALEHFDEKYVDAINYRNKSERNVPPKAVLLVDIESDDDSLLSNECEWFLSYIQQFDCDGFIAADASARTQFWKDRKNFGAIAKHTNAFKLNEDVVIPIESLPEFADFIEKLNCRKELENNISFSSSLKEHLASISSQDDSFLLKKINSFTTLLDSYNMKCQILYDNLDKNANAVNINGSLFSEASTTVFQRIQNGDIIIESENLIKQFRETFHGYDDIIQEFISLADSIRGKKIIVATHMHAGDGNVHVNIPVHSNDYLMLQDADEVAGLIMKQTVLLNGVISGEHGIGLTKLPYIDQSILDDYSRYKETVDPDNIFNPGKLCSDFPKNEIYTPSLNLLEMEAFILEAADLYDLAMSISACVRCGKCKEVCNTHYPIGTMLFSPRNKILGVSLIIEAVLYESQTSASLSFRNFAMLQDISDHCTMCHNCLAPCPVKIDFGSVTLSIRNLLIKRKRARLKLVTWFTLFYLRKKGYYINKLFRILLLKAGYTLQRVGFYINKPFSRATSRIFPKINGMLLTKLPKTGQKSIREVFSCNIGNTFYSFSNPNKSILKSVVYFPGCGSERLFPEISFATIALLYNAGIRVVIPPEYLCCGYPLLANGNVTLAETKSYENRVIFHRMAALLGYMGIMDLIISCGTCYEMMQQYQIGNIFPGSSVIDINEFILKEKLYSKAGSIAPLYYHNPCHSPLKQYGSNKIFNDLVGSLPAEVPFCCGEGGTLALSTPNLSNTLRSRKISTIQSKIETFENSTIDILTTCPSCVQGLSRIQRGIHVKGKSLVVYLAEGFLGKKWQSEFIRSIQKNNGIERIIY